MLTPMLTIALFAVFSVAAVSGLLVIVDSSLRGLNAWRGLRQELSNLSVECAASASESDGKVVSLRRPAIRAVGSRRTAPQRGPALSAAA